MCGISGLFYILFYFLVSQHLAIGIAFHFRRNYNLLCDCYRTILVNLHSISKKFVLMLSMIVFFTVQIYKEAQR